MEAFFFFIAGVQPKTKVLDATPRRCPACGGPQGYAKRVDHYFSLFFIPVLRVRKGEPFIACDSCDAHGSGFRSPPVHPKTNGPGACRDCGRPVSPGFRFCPHCGKEIDW